MASKDSDYLPSDLSSDEEKFRLDSTPITKTFRSSKVGSKRPPKKRAPIKLGKKEVSFTSSDTPYSPMVQSPTSPTSPMSFTSQFSFSQPLTSQKSKPVTSATSKLLFKYEKTKRNSISLQIKKEGEKMKMTQLFVPESNMIIDTNVLQNMLSLMAVCKTCKIGELQIFESGSKISCANYIMLRCNNCFSTEGSWSVCGKFRNIKIDLGDKQIPKKNDLVYSSIVGGRLIGIGLSQLETYHTSINIPLPSSNRRFREAQHSLLIAAQYLAEKSMEKSRSDLANFLGLDPSQQYIHAVASYDGAYQQRSSKSGGGFSRYCFASAISVDIGKILSYGVSCNSCSICTLYENKLRDNKITSVEFNTFYASHSSLCPATYSHLASVHLESAIAPQVISDALKRGIIFSGLVCDGDNKSHDAIIEADVYNGITDKEIIRYECLSHVAKRMKTNLYKAQDRILISSKKGKEFDVLELRKAKKLTEAQIKTQKYRGKLVRDSRTREEWNRSSSPIEIRTISGSVCAQIASYYRIAVQRNKGNIEDIQKAIQAIPYHLGANNNNADEFHKHCPFDSASWCKYQSAKASKKPLPNHPYFISQDCVNLILSVFEEFGYNSKSFISKISDGWTSNHNESVHSILFRMVRKTELVGIDIMKLGSALAVVRYNDGFYGILALFETLGIQVSDKMAAIFSAMDTKRISRSERIISEQSKRFHKKQRRGTKTTRQKEKHGVGYESGKYSAAKKFEFDESSVSDDEVNIANITELSNEEGPSTFIKEKEQEEEEDYCQLCFGTEENELVGIGLSIPEVDGEIAWVSCTNCEKWFHLMCLGLDLEDITDKDWFCDYC